MTSDPPLSFRSIQGKFPRHFRVNICLFGLYLLMGQWHSIFEDTWCLPRWHSVERTCCTL